MAAAVAGPKKLALWHTASFQPILNHRHLESIMATLGFSPLPRLSSPGDRLRPWKEYAFASAQAHHEYHTNVALNGACTFPLPRLPFPRIDALHPLTYIAFLGTVQFYIGEEAFRHFHVRGMPLTRFYDLAFKHELKQVEDAHGPSDEDGVKGEYWFREGTLDEKTRAFGSAKEVIRRKKRQPGIRGGGDGDSDDGALLLCSMVRLDDVIVPANKRLKPGCDHDDGDGYSPEWNYRLPEHCSDEASRRSSTTS